MKNQEPVKVYCKEVDREMKRRIRNFIRLMYPAEETSNSEEAEIIVTYKESAESGEQYLKLESENMGRNDHDIYPFEYQNNLLLLFKEIEEKSREKN